MDIDFEEDEIQAVESKLAGMFGTNKVPTDAQVLADICGKLQIIPQCAGDYGNINKLNELRIFSSRIRKRKSIWQMLPEAIKKLSNAKRAGFIVTFYYMESGGYIKSSLHITH
ncbi:hypothetical protein [Nostoc sp.]